jgi:hypothetical protein
MVTRMLEHLLAYGEPPVRRCVPLALALLHVSDPEQQVVDALSRLSHDADSEVGLPCCGLMCVVAHAVAGLGACRRLEYVSATALTGVNWLCCSQPQRLNQTYAQSTHTTTCWTTRLQGNRKAAVNRVQFVCSSLSQLPHAFVWCCLCNFSCM